MKVPTSFQFSNSRQSNIYSSLERFIGDAPASFYRDACKIMSDNCGLETKTHLVGHLMREIFGWVTEIMLPVDYANPNTPDNYKQKIKDASTAYSVNENDKMIQFWLQRVAGKEDGLHSWAHRESMESVRPTNQEFEDLWNGTELLLDFLLDKIESNYLVYTKELDTVLLKKKITNSDIEKIKKHIPLNHTTMGYFFDKLDHVECLASLEKNDFFKYPQKPLEHENGGISYPYWPPMTYLIKMSKEPSKQGDVLKICLGIDTDNMNIQVQILEIALYLPPDKSVQIIKKSYGWLPQIHSWFHPEKYGQLLIHLADGGFKTEALELATKILAVKPDPRKPTKVNGYTFTHDPIALFDDWHYEKILEENYPEFIDKVGIETIEVLIDLIEDYIEMSSSGKKSAPKDSLSEIWRPAIEDHEQNHESGVKDLLVTGLRNSCEHLLESHPEQILTVVGKLETKKLMILNRLSLHLLRIFPNDAEKKITESLMNEAEFKKERLTHEYFLLAETHGKLLSKKQQETIWSWIASGADVEEFKKWKQNNGQEFNKELGEKYERSWQMYHLMPFQKINSKWKKYFDRLIKEFGQPKYPTFRSWSEGGSWGYKSGIPADRLKSMSPAKVVDFLKEWKPKTNDLQDPSKEGTGKELTSAITDSPGKWTANASSFASLDPTYVRSYLSGFRESLKQGKKFDWKPILEVCKSVLGKPNVVKERKISVPFGHDPDWSWCRNTIVDLITEGFSDHVGKLTLDYRKQAWALIEILVKDPDPTPEREEEYLKSSKDDPLSLAINSIRGDAMSAAIQYGIWLKDSLEETKQKSWKFSKDAPELLKVLGKHLDIKNDKSLAIRSIYGDKLGSLAWLDEEWVKNNQHLIFPAEPELQRYFDASWETYITFVNAFNSLLKILQPQYERAVIEIGKHDGTKHYLESPDQRLAHHLTIFYWRGLMGLDDGLLADFYKVATVELKAEIIEFIGRVAKDDKQVPPEVKDKFITLLEKRIAKVKEDKGDVNEFQSLSWWLASEKFDDNWILSKMLEVLEMGCSFEGEHLIMERFISLVSKFPVEIIQCLRLMVENDKKEWGILYSDGELRSIFDIALKSGQKDAVEATTDFIHRLAARGHLEYKDLV